MDQFGKLKEEKNSLEHDIGIITREIELLKEKSKQKEGQVLEKEKLIVQRKGIRDNLSALKDGWQDTLDDFKAKVVDADNQKSLEGIKRELIDYERRVNNAIEISVK
jgi:chromosome segregation ATPase